MGGYVVTLAFAISSLFLAFCAFVRTAPSPSIALTNALSSKVRTLLGFLSFWILIAYGLGSYFSVGFLIWVTFGFKLITGIGGCLFWLMLFICTLFRAKVGFLVVKRKRLGAAAFGFVGTSA